MPKKRLKEVRTKRLIQVRNQLKKPNQKKLQNQMKRVHGKKKLRHTSSTKKEPDTLVNGAKNLLVRKELLSSNLLLSKTVTGAVMFTILNTAFKLYQLKSAMIKEKKMLVRFTTRS